MSKMLKIRDNAYIMIDKISSIVLKDSGSVFVFTYDDIEDWFTIDDGRTLAQVITEIEGEEVGKSEADIRDELWQYFLQMRGVETPCKRCGGTGRRTYGSSAMWGGGPGGQTMTSGICDHCWGTGDDHNHGVNLKTLKANESNPPLCTQCHEPIVCRCGETCKWHKADSNGQYDTDCRDGNCGAWTAEHIDISDYTYCPFCGRKIEVVE